MADGTLGTNTSTNIGVKCAWCREHPGVLSTCLACAAEKAFRGLVEGVAYYTALEAADDALVVELLGVDYFDDEARIERIGDFTTFLEEWRTSGIDPAELERDERAWSEEDERDHQETMASLRWEVARG